VSVDPKRVYVSDPSAAPLHATVVELEGPYKRGPDGQRYCWWQVTVKGGRETRDMDAVALAKVRLPGDQKDKQSLQVVPEICWLRYFTVTLFSIAARVHPAPARLLGCGGPGSGGDHAELYRYGRTVRWLRSRSLGGGAVRGFTPGHRLQRRRQSRALLGGVPGNRRSCSARGGNFPPGGSQDPRR